MQGPAGLYYLSQHHLARISPLSIAPWRRVKSYINRKNTGHQDFVPVGWGLIFVHIATS